MDIRQISAVARETVTEITGHAFDGIALCEAMDGGWRVEIDVVESRARMGDDDLLTTYELTLGADGALQGYKRLRRAHRFSDPAAA